MKIDLSLPALAVDDFGTVTSVTSRILLNIGFPSVDTAQTGFHALQLAQSCRYGLIVSDLHMKPIDGIELLRHLKSDARTASVPVILLSGDPLPSAVQAAKQAGAIAFVMKASTPGLLQESLLEAVRAAL